MWNNQFLGNLAIAFLIGLLILQSSCITKSSQTEYFFVFEDSLLLDSTALVNSIAQFKCDNCTAGIGKEYQNLRVPGKNSKFFIYNDSTRSGKMVDIYKYNWVEIIASSTPNPDRYFRNIGRVLNEGLDKIPGQFFSLDSLIATIDSSYIVFSNTAIAAKPGVTYNASLHNLADSLKHYATAAIVKETAQLRPVFIYIKSGLPKYSGDKDFNPKMEIYQTMRTFYSRLELLYKKEFSSTLKEQTKALILKSFRKGGIFEIQNKDEKIPTQYTIDQFLDRITSEKRFQYEDVNFFMEKFSFFSDPQPVNDSDIPGTLQGTASYNQLFRAQNNGIIVYEDEVNKNVKVALEPTIQSEDGDFRKGYKYVIESITVNYVNR